MNAAKQAKDAEREPKLIKKGDKRKLQVSQNDPRSLQRHPCGTGSQKYRKGVPKMRPRRWLLEAIWVP